MSKQYMYDISFIILTWNSERYLEKCFASIVSSCEEQEISFEILVSDNGSTDNSQKVFDHFRAQLGESFNVEYLKKNTGTTYPRNLGIKKSRGRYLCILDSDTEIKNGSFADLFKLLSEDKNVGIIVPRLLLPDGSIQNSVKRFPTFLQKILKIAKAVFKIAVPENDFYSNFPFTEVTKVDTAISACWFMRRELTDAVGYLDEKIFYSPEDLDFCVRTRKSGFDILFYPQFEVFHDTQQISHRKPFSKVSRSHFWGLVYYFKKHGGWFSVKYLER